MTSQTPVLPPLDGSISVLPGFCDFNATYNPDHAWVRYPSPSGSGFSTISFDQYFRATHRIARTFQSSERRVGEVVGVIIHCDTILYSATVVGLVRAGLVVSVLRTLL